PAPAVDAPGPAAGDPVLDGAATARTDLGDLVRACAWLHVAVAPAHLLLLPSPAGRTMTLVSVVLAVGFAALRRADRSAALGPAVARHASALLCLALVVVCGEMVLYADVVPAPWASLPMVLCLVAAGGALPSHVQVAVVCPATVVVWAVVMASQGDPVGWIWNVMTLGCALGVAALLHVTHARTMRRLADAQARVRLAALTDQLTGVANRRAFLSAARQAWEDARRTGEHLGVLFLDLDGLKQVNDSRGHAAGDALLALAAATLRAAVGVDGLVARLAGDEFAVLLPGCGPDDLPARVAGLSRALSEAGVAASTGSAHLDGDASVEQVLARADAAMLRVKQGRRSHALPVRQAGPPGARAGTGVRPAAAGPRTGC
ncbi:GGDEF domain-containing protein, partial [Aquipuribacter hungaricus]